MRLLLIFFSLLTVATAANAQSSTRTKGYIKKNGTYVAPSHRTRPDHSKANNWSSKDRVNPYTGKKGTVDPYKPRKHSSRKRRS